MYKKILFVLTFILCLLLKGIAQISDSTVYENYFIFRHELPPNKTKVFLILYPDSSYKWVYYTGSINENNLTYLNWAKTEQLGIWSIRENKTLILKRGDTEVQYKTCKNFVRYKRIQKNNGEYSIKFERWFLEKRPKLKLKK